MMETENIKETLHLAKDVFEIKTKTPKNKPLVVFLSTIRRICSFSVY